MRFDVLVLLRVLSGQKVELHGGVVHEQGHQRTEWLDAIGRSQHTKLFVGDQIIDDLHFIFGHEKTLTQGEWNSYYLMSICMKVTGMESTLESKIRETESLLTEVLEKASPEAIRVAWTGGKDSTVVLFIWKALLDHHGRGPARAINLDTGCKFPEVMAFRDRIEAEWGVDLHVVHPAVEIEGYPLAEDVVSCCRDLKVEPLKEAIRTTSTTYLLTGIRRDEHPDRAGREVMEERSDPPHIMVNPILEWTETDIWAFHDRFNLPHCDLYDLGYRSLGCRPCTAKPGQGEGERGGRDQSKEAAMQTLTSLGYF